MKEVGLNFLLSSALFLLLWSKQVKIFVVLEKYLVNGSLRPGDPVHGPDQPPCHGLLRVAVLAVPGLGCAARGAAARPRRGLAQPRQAAAARAEEGGDQPRPRHPRLVLPLPGRLGPGHLRRGYCWRQIHILSNIFI